MYTRCPECQSTFRITPAQIKVRAGLVRCGRCRTVFQSDQHLLRRLPAGATPETPRAKNRDRDAERKRRRRARESAAKGAQVELFPFP
ncbi:MAG: MJ0042-type zinc finger domain-containing protein, partial [Pseudomonadota bacterium]